MKNLGFVLLAICLIGCTEKPKAYEVYQSLVNPRERAQVIAVGKNWEIKDAVANGELWDRDIFHSADFWKYKSDENLVVVEYNYSHADGEFTPHPKTIYPLKLFVAELRGYKRVQE